MEYFILRQAYRPYSGKHITYHEAHSWDVTMLMKIKSPKLLLPNLLYQYDRDYYLYPEKTDRCTFDLLDAFGVPYITDEQINAIHYAKTYMPGFSFQFVSLDEPTHA